MDEPQSTSEIPTIRSVLIPQYTNWQNKYSELEETQRRMMCMSYKGYWSLMKWSARGN